MSWRETRRLPSIKSHGKNPVAAVCRRAVGSTEIVAGEQAIVDKFRNPVLLTVASRLVRDLSRVGMARPAVAFTMTGETSVDNKPEKGPYPWLTPEDALFPKLVDRGGIEPPTS